MEDGTYNLIAETSRLVAETNAEIGLLIRRYPFVNFPRFSSLESRERLARAGLGRLVQEVMADNAGVCHDKYAGFPDGFATFSFGNSQFPDTSKLNLPWFHKPLINEPFWALRSVLANPFNGQENRGGAYLYVYDMVFPASNYFNADKVAESLAEACIGSAPGDSETVKPRSVSPAPSVAFG